MAECIDCGAYTKFQNGRCGDCYTRYKSGKDDFEEFVPGMNDKEFNYRYGMIKGRIAETLIQELFLTLGYNVFRYGMENTIPGIMELLKGVRSDVYFVEVKFRASGEFRLKDLPKDYPYTNAYIILVSKRHIKCVTVWELEQGKEITPTSHNYLGNRSEFALDKDVIIDYCNFAIQFFENV